MSSVIFPDPYSSAEFLDGGLVFEGPDGLHLPRAVVGAHRRQGGSCRFDFSVPGYSTGCDGLVRRVDVGRVVLGDFYRLGWLGLR